VAVVGAKSITNTQAVCLVPGSVNLARVFAVGTAEAEVPCGFPHFAHGVVMPGTTAYPGDAPPGSGSGPICKFVPVNPSNGNWCFENADLLEFADCSLGMHTVTIWYEYHFLSGPFAHYSKRIRTFNVDCTYLPLCGSNPPETLITAPAASHGYELKTRAFEGTDVSDFNGTWRLRPKSNKADEIVHQSERSKAGAIVTLRIKIGAALLEFRKGDCVVSYAVEKGGFSGGGENKFVHKKSTGVRKGSTVPKSVKLVPLAEKSA
jgi:hypothetical protein